MNDKETISTKVEQPLKEEIDRYADEHGMKRSPAMRDLLKDSLKGDDIALPHLLLILGALLIGIAVTPVAEPQYIMIIGVLVFGGGIFAIKRNR